MKRDLPPHVYRQMVKGIVYHYFRRNGVNVRVDPAAPDFWHTYARLKADRNPLPSNRTFSALIDHYYRADRFTLRKPRTQEDYRLIAECMDNMMGNRDVAIWVLDRGIKTDE